MRDVADTVFIDTGVEAGQLYKYQVIIVNGAGLAMGSNVEELLYAARVE